MSELQDLRAQVEKLTAELARVRDPLARAWPSGFSPPTPSELDGLFKTVTTQFPSFRPSDNESKGSVFFREYVSSFVGLAWMPRAVDAKLNTKLDKLTFQNRCADLLVRLGVQPVDCSLRPFTVALLAHGDINHSVTASFPFNVSFGLGNYTGKMASGSGWKTALETGRVLPATALDLPKLVPSPVSFNGGEAGMFRRTTECW